MHDLPFHALHDGARYLIERFQISYLPASSLLRRLTKPTEGQADSHSLTSEPGLVSEEQRQPQRRPAATTSRSLLDAPSTPALSQPPLIFAYAGKGAKAPRTLNEARILATLLKGRLYLDAEATIAHLIEQAPGSPIIHIATHGRARLDAPRFSAVLLADGAFTAIDAFQLDVQACQLLTLSGCDTGKALIGGGDEQLGPGRAFLAAGAKSLVISLWPVEDAATDPHAAVLREALRAAQCHLLRHAEPHHAHPYFWAAFRLIGDTSALPAHII